MSLLTLHMGNLHVDADGVVIPWQPLSWNVDDIGCIILIHFNSFAFELIHIACAVVLLHLGSTSDHEQEAIYHHLLCSINCSDQKQGKHNWLVLSNVRGCPDLSVCLCEFVCLSL